MSLIHWWPLNGDTQDKITGKSGSLIGGGNVDGSGKIGKCYSSTNNSSTLASCADGISVENCSLVNEVGNQYSFACWFLVHGTHGQYQSCIMSSGDWNAQNCWVIGFNKQNTSISCPVNGYNRGLIPIGFTLTNNKWYHLATVYDNGTSYAYLDGELIGSITSPGIYQSSSTTACIGRDQGHGGFFPYNGDINDLRIYDHALSQAEVKELSKALVIHYTFDDICAESTTNIITGIKSAHGKSSLYGNGVKVDWSAGGADSYFMFNYSQAIKANSVYTMSFDCEGLKSSEVATFALSNLSAASYNIALKNGRNSFTFTAGSDLMNDINTHNRLFFDDKTRTDGAVFYLSNFQLEEKDHATPYTPNSRDGMLVNEAGYNGEAILINTNLTSDTFIGSHSMKFNGIGTSTQSYIDIGDITIDTNYMTFCAWCKWNSLQNWSRIFDFGKSTEGQDTDILLANNGTSTSLYLAGRTAGGGSFPDTAVGTISVGDWYFISAVINDKVAKVYIYKEDGTLQTKEFSINDLGDSVTFTNCYLGKSNWSNDSYFDGQIADFRIYTTALSSDDIKDLYKTKAYVTDKGDMETHQFIEGCANLQITHNGCAETYDIQEIGNAEYEQLEYIASTGTQYIDTGVYWTSEKATIVADLMVTTWKASSTIFGSEERYSGSSRYFAHILHAGSANGNYANYIGTGSIGNTTLAKDTRSVIEYIAHGDQKATTKVTANGTTTTYINNKGYSGTILTRQNSTQTAANRGNIYIFANHNAYNGTAGIQNMAAMRLYRFTMIQDDIYIRDFIPCRRKSDSKVGLFDLVTGQFYTSPVGNFTAGSVVSNEDMQVQFISGNSIQARQIIEL